jgi:hypothetical protein
MEARKNIGLQYSMKDLIVLMSEGNVGGLTVLMEMIKEDELDSFAWMAS